MAKKRNPQDATLRNVRAAHDRLALLLERVRELGSVVRGLRTDLDALRLDVDSRVCNRRPAEALRTRVGR